MTGDRSADTWIGRVARVIAVAFVSGDPDPPAMAARAEAAIGDELGDWLGPLAAEVAEWWPGVDDPDDADPHHRVEHLTDALTAVVLRSGSFTAVARARTSHGDRRHRAEVADLVADEDPELAEARGEAAASDLAPWVDAVVGRAPADPGLPAWARRASGKASGRASVDPPRREPVAPRPAFAAADLPPFEHLVDVAEWFGLHPQHLRWYTDARSMERDAPAEPLRHYTYRWLEKRSGGARLLESPKPMLRFFQRRLLHELVDRIPAHAAAHGFRPGRSVRTFAAPHAGRAIVIRVDLESFFASVHAGRVFGIFRTAGYGAPVAHALTGLVTNTVPHAVRRGAPRPPVKELDAHRRSLARLARPHLPQGAPTSPALANLAGFGLDRRLAGLARSFDATYTRYADDLAFSGTHRLGNHHRRFLALVDEIVVDEGFRVNPWKTKVMGSEQRQAVAGMVVNGHAQVARREYDHLRAVLHDAAVNGPAAANRSEHPDFRAHLLGRIGWVGTGNPTRAARLRAAFDRITW